MTRKLYILMDELANYVHNKIKAEKKYRIPQIHQVP